MGHGFKSLIGLRKLLGLLVGTVLAANTLLLVPNAAMAAAGDHSSVTWSVRPGDADGPDGRSWVELTVNPGDQVTEYLAIDNHSRRPVEFALLAADGYFTDTGRFNMLPASHASTDAGTWIKLPASIALEAGQSAVIPFTISVPVDASPGDHLAGVAASILSTDSVLGVESRVGFRVMTRVRGDIRPAIGVQAEGSFRGSINPFKPGQIMLNYRLDNLGNVRLGAVPIITASGPSGTLSTTREAEPVIEFAPAEQREGSIVVRPVWPVFVYKVDVLVTPRPLMEDESVAASAPVIATLQVVAIPWSQLTVLAIAVLLGVFWWRSRNRRMENVNKMLREAREQGRREGARRDRGIATIIFVLTIVAGTLSNGVASPAHAIIEPEDSRGVGVSVEITPRPSPSRTTPPTPDLAQTGSRIRTPLVLVGGLVVAAGVVTVLVASTRPRQER